MLSLRCLTVGRVEEGLRGKGFRSLEVRANALAGDALRRYQYVYVV